MIWELSVTIKKYKRFFSLAIICLVAVVTGVAVGKIFVDQNIPAPIYEGTASSFMDSETDIVALCERADNGEPVESFSALQLFEIAQYKLEHNDAFYTLMTGDVLTTINQKQITTQLKRDGKFSINKLSPGTVVLGKDTNVMVLTTVDIATGNVTINKDGSWVSTNDPIVAKYGNNKTETYTAEDYEMLFRKKATTAVPYVISSLTCIDGYWDGKITKDENNNYVFSISIPKEMLGIAAIYYSEDIKATSGSSPDWQEVVMEVTIDQNFNFKQIDYVEKYNVFVMGMNNGIKDVFCQKFFYGEDVPTLEEVLNGSAY